MEKPSKTKLEKYWVYILLCENNTYYTGYTSNLDQRFNDHLNGIASKYTRSFKPIRIAQSWEIKNNKSLALKIEIGIKKLNRQRKELVINNPSALQELLNIKIV